MTRTNFTILHKKELIAAHGNKCVKCGESDPNKIQWHHVIPRSLGGEDTIENIIPLCVKCHALEHGHGCCVDTKTGGRPRRKWIDIVDFLDWVFCDNDAEAREKMGIKKDVVNHIIPKEYNKMLFWFFGIDSYRRCSKRGGERNGVKISVYGKKVQIPPTDRYWCWHVLEKLLVKRYTTFADACAAENEPALLDQWQQPFSDMLTIVSSEKKKSLKHLEQWKLQKQLQEIARCEYERVQKESSRPSEKGHGH